MLQWLVQQFVHLCLLVIAIVIISFLVSGPAQDANNCVRHESGECTRK